VQTLVYTVAGDYDTKVTASQSSTQHSYWTVSNTCWFYNSAGICNTPTYGPQESSTFTDTVTTRAALARFLYPPCDSPCKQNLSSSIVINFP